MACSVVLHWRLLRGGFVYGLCSFLILFFSLAPGVASARTYTVATYAEAEQACYDKQVSGNYPSPSYKCVYNESASAWDLLRASDSVGDFPQHRFEFTEPYNPAPSCDTDTIPGGPVNGGWGTGIYDVQGCAYSCGTNYSKLDGQTSMYDAQECTGLGQAYTTDKASDYSDPPAACEVKAADGSCLDMAQQPGGSCPTGTTYGQVNGTDVCVKSGDSTSGLDTGTAGKTGQGGSKPADLGTGEGASDGTNTGGTTSGGTGTGTGTSESTSQCTSSTGADGTVTQTCTTSGTSQQETDYGTVDTPAIGENQFYKPLDKTADSVIQKFAQDVQATPIVSSVTGFFDVQLSGSCPTWTIPGVWVFDPMPIDMQCSAAMENVWPLIAAVLLATCAFFAFRIAFL